MTVDQEVVGSIGAGLVVLIGISREDGPAEAEYIVGKTVNLRIFNDDDGRFNRSALDTEAELLLVSQFTLYGDTTRGRRPGWSAAAGPDHAEPLVQLVVAGLRERGLTVATGRFRADMVVEITNEGPATLMLEV